MADRNSSPQPTGFQSFMAVVYGALAVCCGIQWLGAIAAGQWSNHLLWLASMQFFGLRVRTLMKGDE